MISSIEFRLPDSTALKSREAANFLAFTYYLLPINTFLYSWRYMDSLTQETKGKAKSGCLAFKWLSVIIVPALGVSLYISYVSLQNEWYYYFSVQQFEEARIKIKLAQSFLDALAYWNMATNLLSCLMMGLVIRFAYRLTQTTK